MYLPFTPFSHLQLEWQIPECRRWYDLVSHPNALPRTDRGRRTFASGHDSMSSVQMKPYRRTVAVPTASRAHTDIDLDLLHGGLNDLGPWRAEDDIYFPGDSRFARHPNRLGALMGFPEEANLQAALDSRRQDFVGAAIPSCRPARN